MFKYNRLVFFMMIIMASIMFGSVVGAVPANGAMFEYSQPSGEKFKASVNGDEKTNWVVSETGEVIIQDNDKYWKFAQEVKGKILPSKYKYSKSGQKPLETIKDGDIIIQVKKQQIVPNSPQLSSSTVDETTESSSEQIFQSQSGVTSQKILVLLVQFSNVNMRYSEAQWNNSFFGATGSTVNSYYNEVSGGKFSFAPAEETLGTTNDGIMKVTLNYNHPNNGGNIGSINQKIVSDALTAANPYIDYASFDKNGDGRISNDELHVVTILAGYESSYGGGLSPTVWAHKWATSVTLDGKYLSPYTQQGEVHYDHMATVGVLCHELGHDLGLPDLYDYDYSSKGVGIHSIMAGGSWASSGGYAGNSPTHFDAWSKVFLGFATPTLVSATGGFTVKSFDTGQYNILKIPTTNQNQYFLVENRENVGFDKGLASAVKSYGIAIWHIDESIISQGYRVNDNESHKGVDLEEANEGILGYSQLDKGYSGNYYHYYSSTNVTTFGNSTVPNSRLYEGTQTNISIATNVPASSSMVVNISNGGVESPPVISNMSVDVSPFVPKGSNSATISYKISKDAYVTTLIYDLNNVLVKTLESNILKTSGDNSITWDGKDTSGNIVGDAIYTYRISATDKVGLGATPVSGNITVEKSNPIISNVSDSPDPFTASGSTLSTIGYSISENANVNIKIYDINNNVVKDLFAGQVLKGTKTLTWNGKDNLDKPAQNGSYIYKINAVDSFNNSANEAIGTITIDRGAPITLILYGHKPDPTKYNSKITYSITQPGYITLNIYDSNNNLVRSLVNYQKRSAGTFYTTWTGKNNSNLPVASGVYTYSVQVEDLNGNIAGPLKNTITIDRSGPDILDLTVNPSSFAPTGSNSVNISYNLSENGKVTLNIYDSKNTLVKTIINNGSQTTGLNSLTWDGKNKLGQFVNDGLYTVKASAYDGLINRSATKSQLLRVDKNAPSIDNVSDSPDPLRVGDGLITAVKYTISEDSHVTLNIFDNGGSLIKTLVDKDVVASSQQVTWDGKNSAGSFVANGIYTYKINAIDASGKSAIEQTGTITTDKTPVVINNVSINPSTFMPSGLILYNISKDAKITVKILNSSNVEVKTIENATQMIAGSHTSIWDGKDALGKDVVSGTYKYIISAVDAIGFSAVSVQGTIALIAADKDAPRITSVSDTPDPLKLGVNGAVATIRFTLSETSQVTLRVYNSNNNLINTLLNSNLSVGQRSVEWDGKDSAGNLVADGTYIYKINAVDASGNIGNEAIGTITTDKTPITITNVNVNPDKFSISGSVNYTISESGKITLIIYDALNNPIRTIENATSMNLGLQSSIWDGKDSNNFEVQSGNYTYIITAIDKVGFMATTQGNIIIDGPAPIISNVSSSMELFIPSGLNSVSINYTISSNANVTLNIYDDKNALVKTVINNSGVLRGENVATWNGKNNAGSIVSDGIYTYKINAIDSVGKSSNEAIGTIIIDKTAPTITNVSVSPNPFGTGSMATISYSLSEKATVSIKITDSSNNVIRTLESNILKNSGANFVKYDGKDESGNYAIGSYTYTIAAIDQANFTTVLTGNITCIDSSIPTITSVSNSPEPFILNGTNTINISYSLSKDVSVSLKIYDSTNKLVKTLINNIWQVKGNNSIWWNGKDETNTLINEGIYTYKINAIDGLGNSAVEASGILSAGTSLIISQDKVSVDPFIAIGANTLNISYSLSKKANTTVKVTDSSNNIVKVLFSGQANSGNNSTSWNGKDNSGLEVQDGTYTYKIEVTDSINQKTSVSKSFVVVSSSPQILNVSDSPDPFKADGSLASINYTLSKNSLVTIEIFDSNNNSVKKILNGMTNIKGTNTSYWDGKYSNGSFVGDGVYTYKITVTDPYSKEVATASGTITVEKFPPAGNLNNVTITPNPFAPNGGTNANISYILTGDAYVTISIVDINNTIVKNIQSSTLKNAGANSASWNGKDNDGMTVNDGIFTLKISALNGAGVGNTVTSSFSVDRLSPAISQVTDGPDPFKPTGVDLWDLNFNLSEDANVYLELTDSNNNVVWTARPVIFTSGQRAIELYGTNDSGILLNDGVYNYKLWAVDFIGKNSNVITGTLTTDKISPVISKVSAAPATFTTSTTISYTLSENVNATIIIISGNSVIRTLENNSSKNSGDNVVVWDGKDNGGNDVDNGSYTYKITVTDKVGLTTNATGTVIKNVSTPAPVISSVSDSVDPFQPSGGNTTTISYVLSKNALVSLKIYDNSGNIIKTLLNNYPAVKGGNSVNWDGRNDNNSIISDGVYTYRINAVDTFGNSAVQVGGTITVDRIAPIINNFNASPYPFAPNGINKMTIAYKISENAQVTFEILDDDGNVIKALESSSPKNAGNIETLWDGTIDGSIVDDDIYRIRITAVDNVGNSTEYYDFVGIDRLTPQIIQVDDNPDPFNPTVVSFSTIHGEFSEWLLSSNASIYDKNNNKVREITMDNTVEFWWGWSGKNTLGSLVSDGDYTYKVNGSDLFGKNAQEATGTINIDSSTLEISGLSFAPELENPRGTISYTLSKPAKVSVAVYDSNNNIINQLLLDVQKNSGNNSVYWDGKVNGKFVGYGVYTYKITAVASNGANALPAIGVITFETIDADYVDNTIDDNIGEEVTSGSVNTSSISPLITNNSYTIISGTSQGKVSYFISKKSKVSVILYNKTDSVMRILESDITKEIGTYSVTWDGKDAYGNSIIDGAFYYKITAVDLSGNKATPVMGNIAFNSNGTNGSSNSQNNNTNNNGNITNANNIPPVISSVSISPSKFSPSGNISYTVSETARITLSIYNRTLTLIRTIESSVQKVAGRYTVLWDGKDSDGYEVDDVVYTYKITATDLDGYSATPVAGTIAMNIIPFTITDINAAPSPYNPRGNAGGVNPLSISYTLSSSAKVTATIYSSDGKFIKTICTSNPNIAGRNSITWYGVDNEFRIVAPGIYVCNITAMKNLTRQLQTSVNLLVE